MALAIAYYIREQQDMTIVKEEEKELDDVYKALGFKEDESEEDFGSKITII